MTRARHYMLIAGGACIVTAGCAGKSSPTSVSTAGSESSRVTGIWWLAFGAGAAVYLIVAGLVVYGALRKGDATLTPDRRVRERFVIVIGGVLIPFAILLFFAGVTVNATAHLRNSAPSNTVNVTVTGKRWWWDVSYDGLGVRTANDIHLPVGQPVHLTLVSDNVIHSFWVPQLAGKEDMIPGQTNELTFTIKGPGVFRGLCAEYCGLQHAKMQFFVIAQPAADFVRWIAYEQQLTTVPTSESTAAGERVFMREACAGCHTIRNTPAQGQLGPDLTDVGARTHIAAGALPNTPANLDLWIRDPQHVKPGALMPPVPISDSDRAAIVDYLESLK